MKNDMSKIPTCELVRELEKREGVDPVIVHPYDVKKIEVEGPAIVLIVKRLTTPKIDQKEGEDCGIDGQAAVVLRRIPDRPECNAGRNQGWIF